MENLSFDLVVLQVIFAVLFVCLLFDTKKDSKESEIDYQKVISNLSDNIAIVKNIKEDVEDIKTKLEKVRN